MGVDKTNTMGLQSTPTECSTPEVKQPSRKAYTAEDSTTPTAAAAAAAPLKAKDAATEKPKKKKKKKKSGYKAFMRKAMKSSVSDKEKKAKHLAKISKSIGGGSFNKMDDKL